ncbi:hypothetical protein PYCC9005_005278 [Savitreella phatthalungensis]
MSPAWHTGERAVQVKLGVQNDAMVKNVNIMRSMPPQHQHFFSSLPYFACGTIDGQGRPWAGMVCGPRGFHRALSPNHLAFVAKPHAGDPLPANLLAGDGRIAGLGIEFETRRRNKVFGRVPKGMFKHSEDNGELQVLIETEQSLGNCPKYINVRRLEFKTRSQEDVEVKRGSASLSDDAINHVAACDTMFMASKHDGQAGELSDMDVNHRGGPIGFVRASEDATKLYVPDFSGNNLYQSLGNIESDRLVGLFFPCFVSGNALYITGSARNVFGEEAGKLMPGTQRLTEVEVDEFIYAAASLQLEQSSAVQPSPYNPPVYKLTSEGARAPPPRSDTTAKLIKKQSITPSCTRYTWKLSKPFSWKAGQHAIFDFRDELHAGYAHMDDDDPKSLNETYVRAWTISGTPPQEGETSDELEITVRKAGRVSGFLNRTTVAHELSVPFLGVDGDFASEHIGRKSKLLVVAGGIGITPFLPLLGEDGGVAKGSDVIVLYAGRGDDETLAKQFDHCPRADRVQFFSPDKRLTKQDVENVKDLKERKVLFCGPAPLSKSLAEWLPGTAIEQESFTY